MQCISDVDGQQLLTGMPLVLTEKTSDICDGLCGRKERGTLWCHLGRVFE